MTRPRKPAIGKGRKPDKLMRDGAVNNSARQNMADIRAAFDDLIWFQYGIGSKAVAHAYASGTSTTIPGADVTAVYHAGRRVKAAGSSTGTIYGAVSSSSYNSGTSTTTVNYTWDSGSLANEALTVYLSQVPVTGSPVGANPVLQKLAGNYAVASGTNSYAISVSPAPASYADLIGAPIRVLFTNGQAGLNLTLNVNSLGSKNLVRLGSNELTMFYGDIVAGSIHELVYDGTNFQVVDLNSLAVMGSGTARTTTVPNTNVPTTIFAAVAATCVVFYDFGGGNAFSDVLNFYQSTSVGVAAQSSGGTPGTRTYSMSGSSLQMALSGAPSAASVTPIVLQAFEPEP